MVNPAGPARSGALLERSSSKTLQAALGRVVADVDQ
jgi:hypothetical protein